MADKKVSELTSHTPAIDADSLPILDSAGGILKRITWANAKATLKTYFDTLYAPALGADDNYVTDAEKVVIGNTSGTNTGDSATPAETTTTIGALIGGAADATPNDTDFVATSLTAAGILKKITWTNVKAFLKTYFDTLYLGLAGGTLTGDITLGENTAIALDPAGSADGKYSGIVIGGTSGYSQAFGDLVTLDKDDSRWEAVDISVAAAATGDARGVIGIVVSTGTDGNPCKILLHGVIRADANFPALTIGAPVYASTTGDIVVTQPTTTDHVIRVVGFALTADEIYFNPENDYITHA